MQSSALCSQGECRSETSRHLLSQMKTGRSYAQRDFSCPSSHLEITKWLLIIILTFLLLSFKETLEYITVTFTNASELFSGNSNSTSMKAYQQNGTTITHQHVLTVADENKINAGYFSMEVTEEAIETFSVVSSNLAGIWSNVFKAAIHFHLNVSEIIQKCSPK